MAEEEGKKEEFDFDATGEALAYISLEQARVVAMRTARDEPGNYGRTLTDTRMVYQLVEQENGEDYYIVTMSFRPEGDFAGTEGQEQFFIEKEGTVAYRQVLSLPRSAGRKRIPVIPAAIGLAVVIVAAAVIALVAGPFSTISPAPSVDVEPTPVTNPEEGLSPGAPAEATPAAQVKFPGFNFQLAEGAFWEYKWETESSSFCRDCPRGSRKDSGSFLVSLGPPKVIQGDTVYQVRLSGEYKKKDGKNLSFAPRWRYVGVNDNKIVASEDGATFVVIFDGEKGEWQGGGFFSSRFGTDTEMSAREGQIPDPIAQWPEVRQGPVLAVGQSAKDGECRYERLTGTTVCDANRSTTSQSELFREGVGPVAYFFSSSFSSGSGSTSFSASSREYVGLVSSSLLGDVSAAAPPQISTTVPAAPVPSLPASPIPEPAPTTSVVVRPLQPDAIPKPVLPLASRPTPRPIPVTPVIRRIATTPVPAAAPTPVLVASLPASGRIGFMSSEGQLHVVDADGTDLNRLTTGTASWHSWSPNGKRLVYDAARRDTQGTYQNGLYIANGDGSGEKLLVLDGGVFYRPPVWSPDGRRIAFEGSRERRGISVINADGTGEISLVANKLPERAEAPAWSPDNQRIAFTYWSGLDSKPEIYVVNADGTGRVNLTNGPASDFHPTWAPDGRRIAFSSDRMGEFDFDIYIMDADGTKVTRLTDTSDGAFSPTWSPDGQRILFQSQGSRVRSVHVINVDGSSEKRLSDERGDSYGPVWSPDGAFVAFATNLKDNTDIYVAKADGTKISRVTESTALEQWPAWTNP